MNVDNAPVAIIGFGVAGFNAALGMRGAGYSGPIQVFSDLKTLPYSPILTSYYAGGMKEFEECFPWSAEEVAALGLDVRSGRPVVELDVEAHEVRTEEGSFPYSKCVIATGSSPTSVGFPEGCGYEPRMLHSMEDAARLKAAISDPGCSRVLVSGASMVALKILEACLAKGLDATLVGMNPHVLDYNALPEAAARFERGLRSKGVALRLGQTIKEVEVVRDPSRPLGRVLKVTFSNGEADEFDEIAVAHGMKSNLDFLPEGALEADRALLVDEFMRTSDPDVYAAGDVAQALELVSGERRVVGIWKNAATQGACAGKAIAAELAGGAPDAKDAFAGSISSNTIAVDGTLFISAGSMELGPGRHSEVREDDGMTVVYVYEDAEDASAGSGGSEAPVGVEGVCSEGLGAAKAAGRRLVGFNITSDTDEEGGVAYDTGAMLTMRILDGLRGR